MLLTTYYISQVRSHVLVIKRYHSKLSFLNFYYFLIVFLVMQIGEQFIHLIFCSDLIDITIFVFLILIFSKLDLKRLWFLNFPPINFNFLYLKSQISFVELVIVVFILLIILKHLNFIHSVVINDDFLEQLFVFVAFLPLMFYLPKLKQLYFLHFPYIYKYFVLLDLKSQIDFVSSDSLLLIFCILIIQPMINFALLDLKSWIVLQGFGTLVILFLLLNDLSFLYLYDSF